MKKVKKILKINLFSLIYVYLDYIFDEYIPKNN